MDRSTRRPRPEVKPREPGRAAAPASPAPAGTVLAPTANGISLRETGIAFVAGLLALSSFAPIGFVPGAWLGIAMLLLQWRRSTPLGAWWSHVVFSTVLLVVGAYWVGVAIARLGTWHWAWSVVVCVIYWAWQCSIFSLVPLLAKRFWPGSNARAYLLLVPALWAMVELLRALLALTWVSVGTSQTGGPLQGFAPWLGVQGVTLSTVVAGGLLALAWEARPADRWKPAAGFVGLLVLGLLAGSIQWTRPSGRPFLVGLVQGNLASDTVWDFVMLDQVLAMYREQSMALEARAPMDLVIWPETAAPVPYHKRLDFFRALGEHARASGTDYLVGTQSQVGKDLIDSDFYNIALHPSDMVEYRKRRLVPLGETLPPGLFTAAYRRKLKADAVAIFSPGADRQEPIRIHGQPIEVAICFESLFGNLLRRMPSDTGFLVMITSDELFMGTPMPPQHLQVARMRAIELQRDVARAGNSGISAFIDADGRIGPRTRMQQRETLVGTVQPRTGSTPYMRWGDGGVLLVGALLVVLSRLPRRTRV